VHLFPHTSSTFTMQSGPYGCCSDVDWRPGKHQQCTADPMHGRDEQDQRGLAQYWGVCDGWASSNSALCWSKMWATAREIQLRGHKSNTEDPHVRKTPCYFLKIRASTT
jgi:hypothetical protein